LDAATLDEIVLLFVLFSAFFALKGHGFSRASRLPFDTAALAAEALF
jgi:hypothetical protein